MMKKILLGISLMVALGGGMLVPPTLVSAQDPLAQVCSKLSEDDQKKNSACGHDPDKNPLFTKDGLLNKIARGIAMVAGSVAIIFMIIGGYKMILSNSDKQAFTNGRNTLIYAAVGLIVITIAQSIVTFIISRIG